MIVPAMNSDEIVKEILLDLPKVRHKINFFSTILRRAAIKSKSKSIVKCWDYKSPRKNDWVILIKTTPSYYSIVTTAHYLNKMGFNCLSINSDGDLHHYSGHYLERYNERFLNQHNLSKLDLFKQYIKHNSLVTVEVLSPDGLEIKKIIVKVNDGIAFGTIEIIDGHKVFDYRTFISNDMVLDYQKKGIDFVNKGYDEYCNEIPVVKKMELL